MNAEGRVTADSTGDGNWGDNDPSIFVVRIEEGPLGEFQVTNGYGPVLAPQVMQVFFVSEVMRCTIRC